jgi:hypothetical protein
VVGFQMGELLGGNHVAIAYWLFPAPNRLRFMYEEACHPREGAPVT